MNTLIDNIQDFCSSDHFLFLDAGLKPHAEAVLARWCTIIGPDFSLDAVEKSLREMAQLDLALEIRKAVPHIIKAFLEYLNSTIRVPEALQLLERVSLLEAAYFARFRADGTVRGEPYEKKYTDTGRNAPCPCGSGRKFKQCCGKMVGS